MSALVGVIMGWVDVSRAAFLQRRESYLIYK